jgi:hypothetical protein
LKHSTLRALIAIVFVACVAIVGRTASAAPLDSTLTPTNVALATPAASPAAKAVAKPTATPVPTPTPTAAPPAKLIQLSGEADLGYTRVPQGGNTVFSNGGNSRVFDGIAVPQSSTSSTCSAGTAPGRCFSIVNQPDIQDIYIGATITAPAGIGGEFDIAFGSDPNVFASFPQPVDNWNIVQAYLTYTYKAATFTVGKFNTLAGAEYIKSSMDWEYSKSILNGNAIPFTHTGVRLTMAPSPKFNYIIGENLGWDAIRSTGNARTTEGGIIFNPSAATNLTVQSYIGKEPVNFGGVSNYYNWPTVAPGAPGLTNPLLLGMRHLYDAVLTGHVTSALTLMGNYDYGIQQGDALLSNTGAPTGIVGTARWQGGAAYANYQVTPKWSGTVRGELFRDGGGFRTGFDQKWGEQTITAQYQPSSPLMLRLEYRNDDSNQPVFLRTDGTTVKFEHTLGLEAIAKF